MHTKLCKSLHISHKINEAGPEQTHPTAYADGTKIVGILLVFFLSVLPLLKKLNESTKNTDDVESNYPLNSKCMALNEHVCELKGGRGGAGENMIMSALDWNIWSV